MRLENSVIVWLKNKKTDTECSHALLPAFFFFLRANANHTTPNVSSCLKVTCQMANCKGDIPLKSFNLCGRCLCLIKLCHVHSNLSFDSF